MQTTAPRTKTEHEERELLEALLRDHPSAWRDFQRRYAGLVMRCITGVTKRFPVASPDDDREIYGQLQISLVLRDKAKLRAYDPSRGSHFSSYLGMLATRCAYDWLRGIRRETGRAEISEAIKERSQAPDPFEIAAHREEMALVCRALANLSERDRRFATLYFGEGMNPGEIARSMKISLKTVYSKKHKIKIKLGSTMDRIKAARSA